eukprot:1200391-Rhodomonas_salina.2
MATLVHPHVVLWPKEVLPAQGNLFVLHADLHHRSPRPRLGEREVLDVDRIPVADHTRLGGVPRDGLQHVPRRVRLHVAVEPPLRVRVEERGGHDHCCDVDAHHRVPGRLGSDGHHPRELPRTLLHHPLPQREPQGDGVDLEEGHETRDVKDVERVQISADVQDRVAVGLHRVLVHEHVRRYAHTGLRHESHRTGLETLRHSRPTGVPPGREAHQRRTVPDRHPLIVRQRGDVRGH